VSAARKKPRKVAAEAAPPPMATALDACEQLRAIVDAQIARLNDPKEARLLSERQRVQIASSAAQTLSMIGKISGETLQVPDGKLVRLPAFRRVTDVIVRTLTPWPDAMRAVGLVLTQIAQGDKAP